MKKVELPDVWKKSICYTCKHRSMSSKERYSQGMCCKGLIMAERMKRCRSYEKEESEE
jgi:hypothetical protein